MGGRMGAMDYSDLTALIALGLPVLALATVIVIAVRQISKRRQGRPPLSSGRYGEAVREAAAPPRAAEAPVPPPTPPSQGLSASELAARIAKAEIKPDERELAPLYLARGRNERAEGRNVEAAETLLKAIRLAAKLGLKEAHAAARLELGDIIGEQGDLTTACEHWQIARGLFHDLKRAGELAAVEKRMRQNGCPTDWVLNDF